MNAHLGGAFRESWFGGRSLLNTANENGKAMMAICYDYDLVCLNTLSAATMTGPTVATSTWFGGPSSNGILIDFVCVSRRGLWACLSRCGKLAHFARNPGRKLDHWPLMFTFRRIPFLPARDSLTARYVILLRPLGIAPSSRRCSSTATLPGSKTRMAPAERPRR